MIGAKLDGETQRNKLISTRHPKQAATRSIFAPAKARRRKSSSSVAALDFVACQNVAEGGEYP
jgi:hypothetical protein